MFFATEMVINLSAEKKAVAVTVYFYHLYSEGNLTYREGGPGVFR